MRKRVFYSITILALVLAMALSMVAPVAASEIGTTKELDPDNAPYHVGEWIYFEMTVVNPAGNSETNTVTRIWDTLPDGTVIEFVGSGDPPLVQEPGDREYYYASYMVRAEDLGVSAVINTFEAEGYDSAADLIYSLTQKRAEVVPPVGGEAFPISRLGILAPWVALGAAIIAAAVIFARRHPVQS